MASPSSSYFNILLCSSMDVCTAFILPLFSSLSALVSVLKIRTQSKLSNADQFSTLSSCELSVCVDEPIEHIPLITLTRSKAINLAYETFRRGQKGIRTESTDVPIKTGKHDAQEDRTPFSTEQIQRLSGRRGRSALPLELLGSRIRHTLAGLLVLKTDANASVVMRDSSDALRRARERETENRRTG